MPSEKLDQNLKYHWVDKGGQGVQPFPSRGPVVVASTCYVNGNWCPKRALSSISNDQPPSTRRSMWWLGRPDQPRSLLVCHREKFKEGLKGTGSSKGQDGWPDDPLEGATFMKSLNEWLRRPFIVRSPAYVYETREKSTEEDSILMTDIFSSFKLPHSLTSNFACVGVATCNTSLETDHDTNILPIG